MTTTVDDHHESMAPHDLTACTAGSAEARGVRGPGTTAAAYPPWDADGIGSPPRGAWRGSRSTRGRWRVTGEDGSVSVELVVATPLLLLLLLSAVQAGLWWHATHIAQSAAAHALAATRVEGGTVAGGQEAGDRVLTQLAHGLLLTPQVSVHRDGQTARVEVTGTAMQVVPGVNLPVHATAAGAPEPPP